MTHGKRWLNYTPVAIIVAFTYFVSLFSFISENLIVSEDAGSYR